MSQPRGNGGGPGAGEARQAGLCASCRFAHVQGNTRGSAFWRCGRADDDPRFQRYPPLPVRSCPGHEAAEIR